MDVIARWDGASPAEQGIPRLDEKRIVGSSCRGTPVSFDPTLRHPSGGVEELPSIHAQLFWWDSRRPLAIFRFVYKELIVKCWHTSGGNVSTSHAIHSRCAGSSPPGCGR